MVMNSNFPVIEVARSASHKYSRLDSFQNWVSDEFFCSAKGQCLAADLDATSAELHDFCQREVASAFAEIRSRLESQGLAVVEGDAPAPREPYEMPRRAEPEENPFKVSAAPAPELTHDGALIVPPQNAEPIEAAQPEVVQSGAPEATPARRGRKAAPKPEGPAAMEALKQSLPPDSPVLAMVKPASEIAPKADPAAGYFRATDDDLPANIAAAPHEPAAPKSQVERLKAIEAQLAADHKKPLEAVGGPLRAFVKAFLGGVLPKPPDPRYEAHLPLWESFARFYGAQLLSKPVESGEAAGGAWAVFVRKIDAWPLAFKVLASDMAAYHYPDSCTDLLEFLETDGLLAPDVNMWTFLQLLRIGRNALLAARDAATKRGVVLSQVVGKLNLDIASEKDVLSAVAGA